MKEAPGKGKGQAEAQQPKAGAVLTKEQLIINLVSAHPWIQQLASKDAHAKKLVRAGVNNFNKHKKALMRTLGSLEGAAAPVESLMAYFNNDEEIALAVMIQNCMHPKNSNRVDAVKNGTYMEIESLDAARAYLSELLSTHLEHEINAVENEVAAEIAALA